MCLPAQYSTQSSGAVAVVVVLYGAGRSCRPGRTLAKKMNKLTYVPNLDGTIVWVYHKTPRHPEAHVVSGALIIREPYLVLGHFRAPPFLLRRAQSGSLRAPSGPVDARPGEGLARPGIPGLLPETPGKTPGLAPGMDRRPNPE